MGLAIHLLGNPTIEQDGALRPPPRGHKPWALLALMLLSDVPISRERLAGLLFADAEDPLGSLRWNLAQLRRLLGPQVSLEGDPVRLELPPDTRLDVRTLVSGTWVEALNLPGLGRELHAYLWIHGHCLDALCEQAITHGVKGADRWVSDLEAAAAQTGMNELLVRAQLHRAAIGMPGARESAAVFAERIDNPAVLRRTGGHVSQPDLRLSPAMRP